MAEFQHRFAHTNGIWMHYVEAGSGPTAILCHGFPECWYSWRQQIRALAGEGFRVVAPYQRGYGETDAPEDIEAYSLCHLAADIVGLLYDLGEQHAIVIGHDWGAPVAWTAALLRPDLYRGVGLLSVPYLQNLWGGQRPTAGMRAMVGSEFNFYQLYFQEPGIAEAELAEDARKSLLGIYYSASAEAKAHGPVLGLFPKNQRFVDTLRVPGNLPSWLEPEDFDYYVQQFERSGFRGPVNWYRNLDRNAELLAFLKNARILQPSLFLAGESDGVVSLYRHAFDGLESTMPGLRHKLLIPNAGHWVQQEQPEPVNRALVEFCSSLRASAATA